MKKKLPTDLYEEALAVLAQSEILRKTVDWQYQQVERLVHQYSDDEFEALPWDEKEKHLKECDEIYGRLEQSVKELKVLDDAYRALAEKVKKRVGRDVMPPISGNIPGRVGPEDEVELL